MEKVPGVGGVRRGPGRANAAEVASTAKRGVFPYRAAIDVYKRQKYERSRDTTRFRTLEHHST